MAAAGDPRQGPRWRAAKAAVRRRGGPCGICGQPIDYQLAFAHPRSFSVHHVMPIAAGGVPYDLANLMPSHLRCNQDLGARGLPPDHTSRTW